MQNKLEFIGNVIYKMKKSYGGLVELHRVTEHDIDPVTGIKDTTHEVQTIQKAVVVHARHFITHVYPAQLATNFREGGFFDPSDRALLLDAKDLSWFPEQRNFWVWQGERWDIYEVLEFENDRFYVCLSHRVKGTYETMFKQEHTGLILQDAVTVALDSIGEFTQTLTDNLSLTQRLIEVPPSVFIINQGLGIADGQVNTKDAVRSFSESLIITEQISRTHISADDVTVDASDSVSLGDAILLQFIDAQNTPQTLALAQDVVVVRESTVPPPPPVPIVGEFLLIKYDNPHKINATHYVPSGTYSVHSNSNPSAYNVTVNSNVVTITQLTDNAATGTFVLRSFTPISGATEVTFTLKTLDKVERVYVPLDENGWAQIPDPVDAQYIAVDATLGNDANGWQTSRAAAQAAPMRTIAAARARFQTRNNFGDVIMFKYGEVWNEAWGIAGRSGKNRFEPCKIEAYGNPALGRPRWNIHSDGFNLGSGRFWYVADIDMVAYRKYPFSPNFEVSQVNTAFSGFDVTNPSWEYFWIENCRVRGCETNYTFQNRSHTHASNYLIVRRCVSEDAKRQGLFVHGCRNFIIEEMFLDQNGFWNHRDGTLPNWVTGGYNKWSRVQHNNQSYELRSGTGTGGPPTHTNFGDQNYAGSVWTHLGASYARAANFFDHNVYIDHEFNSLGLVNAMMTTRASHSAIQYRLSSQDPGRRSYIVNLCAGDNPLGLQIGSADTAEVWAPDGCECEAYYCTVTNSIDLNSTNPRGNFYGIAHIRAGVIDNIIAAHNHTSITNDSGLIVTGFHPGVLSSSNPGIPTRNVQIRNAKFFNAGRNGGVFCRFPTQEGFIYNLTIENTVYNDNFTFNWNIPQITGPNIVDNSRQIQNLAMRNPSLGSLRSYADFILGETNSLPQFLKVCRNRDKSNWETTRAYGARAANRFIRAQYETV